MCISRRFGGFMGIPRGSKSLGEFMGFFWGLVDDLEGFRRVAICFKISEEFPGVSRCFMKV